MKRFLRLLGATLIMTASFVFAAMLISFVSIAVYVYLGFVQALVAFVLAAALAITALIHWSEQDDFPFQ